MYSEILFKTVQQHRVALLQFLCKIIKKVATFHAHKVGSLEVDVVPGDLQTIYLEQGYSQKFCG